MTKLEEIARAIYFADALEYRPHNWEKLEQDGKAIYFDLARAAVEAMREPSDNMENAGGNHIGDDDTSPDPMQAGFVWQAMCDAILNENVLTSL